MFITRPHVLMLALVGTCSLFVSSLYAQKQAAVDESGTVYLLGESFEGEKLVDLSTNRWRFREGDNPAWAAPSFDDSAWVLIDTDFQPDSLYPEAWQGLGWFRLHVRVDSALHNTMLGVSTYHLGASEIYLDGRYIGGFGVIGTSAETDQPYTPKGLPLTLSLDDRDTHVLTVRYANRGVSREAARLFADAPYLPVGFAMVVGRSATLIHSYVNAIRSLWTEGLLSGILAILALLYLVLFLFDRTDVAYLFFGIAAACGAPALILLSAIQRPVLIFEGTTDLVLLGQVGGLFVMAHFLFLLLSFYAIFARRWMRYAWAFVLLGFALLILQNIGSRAGTFVAMLMILLFVVEMVRITVYAIYERKEGAWILGAGVLTLLVVLVVVAVTGSWDSAQSMSRVYLWETPRLMNPQLVDVALIILSVPMAMSVLLAHRFARRRTIMRETELRAELAEEQTRHLEALDQAKSRFFANISHEFRTPLTLLLGPLQEALRKEKSPERLMQQVPLMHRNAARLLRLVNQLLDLAKLEAGSMRLHLREIDLTAFLRQLVLAFAPQAERDGLTLLFDAPEEALVGSVDPDKLERIVTNLLANAFKFTRSGGKVRVGLTATDDKAGCLLTVSDTGQGIPEDALPHVFDRFYQVDGTTARAQEGTGIGLALVKELVELHQGIINVESKQGFGTTFTIHLPVVHPDAAPKAVRSTADRDAPEAPYTTLEIERAVMGAEIVETPAEEAPASEAQGTVIVVDDNADVRAFVCGNLKMHFRVLEAADGEAGLALIREHQPDLVISDVMMPKMDGHALCRALKADETLRHIPVILLTAKAEESDKIYGLEGGADDYLTKPFSLRELEVRVTNLILSRRHLREQYSRTVLVQPAEVAITSADEAFMQQVLEVLNRHLGDSRFNTDRLADEVGLSRRQVERKVKMITKQTPPELMRHLRLERAAQILKAHPGSIAEVAYAVGFKSPAHFSAVFRKTYGHTPSEHIGHTT